MGKKWKQWQTIFLVYKITVDGDCSHEIKRRLLLGRKTVTNLDSVLKSRDSFFFFSFLSISGSRLFYKKLCTFLQHNPRDRPQHLPPPWRSWPTVLLWWRKQGTCFGHVRRLCQTRWCLWRTRWWRSIWTWSTSLSVDTSGIRLQTQKCMQNTSWEQTGVPDQLGKNI